MSCLDNIPENLEFTFTCASDLVSAGPVSGFIILIIGIPLIGVAKLYIRKIFDNIELDEGLENFIYRLSLIHI